MKFNLKNTILCLVFADPKNIINFVEIYQLYSTLGHVADKFGLVYA